MNGEIKSTTDVTQARYGSQERSVGKPREEEGAGVPTRAVPGSDSVELTDKARQLQRIEQKLSEFPAVDSQRVESIRQAIADGSYRIDADLIAERLLASDALQKTPGR